MIKKINTPLNERIVVELKSGDNILLSGTVYTARDAAHKRMYEAVQNNETLPIDMDNNIIYYM